MSISVEGINFTRPSVNFSTEFRKDSDGNNIGQRDTITIQDVVLSSDNNDLAGFYSNLVDKLTDTEMVTVDYPGNSGSVGRIKNLSLDNDSDFVNKLSYSVTLEAIPQRSLYSLYELGDLSGVVNSLTESESWDVPYDLYVLAIPTGQGTGFFYNKPITYEYNLNFSCGYHPSGSGITSSLDAANKILTTLGKTSPSSGLVSGIDSRYINCGVSSVQLNRGTDGTTTLNIKSLFLPSGTGANPGNFTASLNRNESKDEIQYYSNRDIKVTINALPVGVGYTSSGNTPWSITGVPTGLAESAYGVIESVRDALIDTSGMIEIEETMPGKKQSCSLPHTALTSTGCWSTKLFSMTKDYSNNSATLNIEQTTQNIGMCDYSASGYKINYEIIKHSPRDKQKVYAEPRGWSSPDYWVQDMNTFKDEYYEYSINVASTLACSRGDTGITGIANTVFTGIDLLSGSGIITSKVISVSKDTCSLKIVQYSGENLSETGIGYSNP